MGRGLGLSVLHTPFHSGWALARLMELTSHMFLCLQQEAWAPLYGDWIPTSRKSSYEFLTYVELYNDFFFITGLFHLV